jgi:Nucleoside phosphorylase
MINILIVDDSPEKLRSIKVVLDSIIEKCEDVYIDVAMGISETKRIVSRKNIDIMILDIQLPQRVTDTPEKDGGIRLLKELKDSRRYKYPNYVISISRYEESIDVFKNSEGNIHTSIIYDDKNAWKDKLLDCIKIFLSIVNNNVVHRNYEYDIAVICALQEEIEEISHSLEKVERIRRDEDDEIYYNGYWEIPEKKIKVVFGSASQIGMVAATSLATKMIYNFTPRYLVMTGIAAGTDRTKMNYGDVVVAATVWDYRAGKDVREDEKSEHINSIKPFTIDTSFVNWFRELVKDEKSLRKIRDDFHGKKPETQLKLLCGSVVSGASVVTDSEIVKGILKEQSRDILALEMEIYGVYYAANWAIKPRPKFVALKSISDFADKQKGDDYHQYASYTSAKIFEKLAKEYFEYDF